MKQIRIPVPLAMLAFVAATVAAVAAQFPELRRYMKMRAM